MLVLVVLGALATVVVLAGVGHAARVNPPVCRFSSGSVSLAVARLVTDGVSLVGRGGYFPQFDCFVFGLFSVCLFWFQVTL